MLRRLSRIVMMLVAVDSVAWRVEGAYHLAGNELALVSAMEAGDVDVVKGLLKQGVSPAALDWPCLPPR